MFAKSIHKSIEVAWNVTWKRGLTSSGLPELTKVKNIMSRTNKLFTVTRKNTFNPPPISSLKTLKYDLKNDNLVILSLYSWQLFHHLI